VKEIQEDWIDFLPSTSEPTIEQSGKKEETRGTRKDELRSAKGRKGKLNTKTTAVGACVGCDIP
jgi:hypothetical protein